MANFTVLDKSKHQNLRVITERGGKYGENTHLVPVTAEELSQLVLEYPVCLIKDNDTGRFGLQALLGFEVGENLFLSHTGWGANYVPLHIRRQPFMVTVNAKVGEQPSADNTNVSINLENPRVQDQQGEMLYDQQQQPTAFLKEITSMLGQLVNGILRTEAFIETLSSHHLIELIQLTVSFADGHKQQFEGIYTINEKALNQLDAETLNELNGKGYLKACYLLLASMGHVQKLTQLKRQKLKG